MNLLVASEVARSLPHGTVLTLLLQLGLLLGVARFLGELCRKIGQPSVVGELVAGLLLGPSCLGALAPAVHSFLFPADPLQEGLLSAVSLLGVLTLLIVTGFEIDLNLIRAKSRTAVTISLGGIIAPFLMGMGLGWVLPESCLAQSDQRVVFSLFLAVALSISAIPVIAKVLMDLKLMRRDIGQVIMAAAMLDDSVGWLVLAVVAGLAQQGHVAWGDVAKSTLAAITVMGLGLSAGRASMSRLLAFVDNRFPGSGVQLSFILVVALGAGALTHSLHLEAILGAFLVGILAGQAPRLRRDTTHTLEMLSGSFLAPIFFSTAGLRVNLTHLMRVDLLELFLVVLVVASFGKYSGCYLAGLFCRLSHWERLALGSGMNPRGAMGVIVASLGYSAGVLNQDMYSILVGMAIVTSLLAPPLLRYCLGRLVIGEAEAARLADEEREAASFIYSLRRVLIPSRGGLNAQLATQLLGYLDHHHHIEVTALVAIPPGSADEAESTEAKVQDQLEQQPLSSSKIKVVQGKKPLDVIRREAEKGYDLLVLGASGAPNHSQSSEALFNPLINSLLQTCPCPILVVRAHPDFFQETLEIHKILVPVVGTQGSLHATELAATMAARARASLTLLRVVSPPDPKGILAGQKSYELANAFSERLVDRHADIARHLQASADTMLAENHSVEQVIIDVARQGGYDLIVMACHRQNFAGQVYLGHRVESVLHQSPCAVAVICTL